MRDPPRGWWNRGRRVIISDEQGDKVQILRGTKTILRNREHEKTNVQFLGNRGTSQFISGLVGPQMYVTL